ncbi:helix-turn-helix domain-containing protein [Pseudomonas moraviensis]|uniref:helix-turn-helix domain-containing protein n=1 Tax=Pseudomonas moraviensis TaxID=321662 RepID=UPI00135E941B|nr:helix-turn-helix transcriptional regulator [Pseudomonas moraviensis]MXI50156.1 helix-turn-helix domain-containing protein [Pseudomonas moraviensis]
MTIGERLKEERSRLGLSQTDLGAAGGVGKTTQINYEKGTGTPDAKYLAAVEELGVDVLYVVTGRRIPVSNQLIAIDELEMVLNVRGLLSEDKEAVKRLMLAFSNKK